MNRFATYATLHLWLGIFLLAHVTTQVTHYGILISQIDYPVGPPIGQHEVVTLTQGVERLSKTCNLCFYLLVRAYDIELVYGAAIIVAIEYA